MSPPSLAVVVPTLDEASNLGPCLAALAGQVDEIVVSDGGSTDGTRQIAIDRRVRLVDGQPGRGGQLHRGTLATSCDVVLFLHADTRLPAEAYDRIRAAARAGAVGGGFTILFVPATPLLRLGSHLASVRSRITRLPLGDQAQWATRTAYDAVGGFRPWPILEDLDLMRRLKSQGRVVVLPGPARSSARRFERLGVVRTVATNWLIWMLYFAGVSPRRLERFYGR